MRLFTEVAAVAETKGCRLERGDKKFGWGGTTGYILWYRGLWRKYPTLKAVMERLDRLPTKSS